NGVSRKEVCQQHGVNAGYLSVCIRRLSRIEKLVMELARFY
ncbi:transcriptional regulator, partial [Escherichia coli]|nr:transcriptional regulator [Escherichia coli]